MNAAEAFGLSVGPKGAVTGGEHRPPTVLRTCSLEHYSRAMASADRRLHHRGYRVEKAQAGWDIWLGRDRVDWAPTKIRAKKQVDELLARGQRDREGPYR
jgi:hypothetical protein